MIDSLRRFRTLLASQAPRVACFLTLVVALTTLASSHPASAQNVLDVSTLTKYLDPLPNPLDAIIAPSGTLDGVPLYEVSISQFQQKMHSQLAPTTLWGYNGMFPGPTFEVRRDEAIKVRWTNNLRDANGVPLKHFLPYDPTLHGAGPYSGEHAGHGGATTAADFPQARTVTHLHGGVTEEASDGYPEHWFTPDPTAAANGLGGPAGNSFITNYTNPQRAAGMWYHDHAMGITRLNVYAGLAGFYFIRDDEEDALNLPSGKYEVPLMIQDKSFYEDGSLYYPGADAGDPNGFGSHVTSFQGDANVVNGVVWPFMEVEPRKYRFRMLNAANTRSYNLFLAPDDATSPTGYGEPLMLGHIGADGGLFPQRYDHDSIELYSSDRADVIVDFSQFTPGQTLRMLNYGINASEGTTDEVMQFRVVPLTAPDASSAPVNLSSVERYQAKDAVRVRQLALVRGFDEEGGVRLLLNGKRWDDPVTEIMKLDELEIWEISNTTGEDHPIHLHLEAFQVLARRHVNGDSIPLEPWEQGWEDTFVVKNGEVASFAVKYDKFTGRFVWHCHILEHEDHEMMRPLEVIVPEPAAATLACFALALFSIARRSQA